MTYDRATPRLGGDRKWHDGYGHATDVPHEWIPVSETSSKCRHCPASRFQTSGSDEPVVDEVARMTRVLDEHLPTVIHGLGVLVRASGHKNRDELTVDEMAARAAYSAAHHIAKGIACGDDTPLYDLPSVLDLMGMLKKQDAGVPTRAREIEELLATKTAAARAEGAREPLAEVARLTSIIERARDFDGQQTVNGVTDEGWLNPAEWVIGKVHDILSEIAPPEPDPVAVANARQSRALEARDRAGTNDRADITTSGYSHLDDDTNGQPE